MAGRTLLRAWQGWRRPAGRRRWPATSSLALAGILLLTLLSRLLAARDLAFPAWVDSPHHALLIELIQQAGRIPADYQPLLPVSNFHYHIGAHVVFAAAGWLTGQTIPQTMLLLGQVLNALMPLAVYTAAELLTHRRGAGLAAAALVGLVSFFPGYYVTWGRYTQLAGILLLAPALGLVWQTLAPRAPLANRWRAGVVLGVVGAGLLLTHYRVFFFLGGFVSAAMVVRARTWRAWPPLYAALGLGGVLALPWEIRLWQEAVRPLIGQPGSLAALTTYNDFPLTYFQSWLERGWLAAATLCLLAGLVKRRPWIWAIGLWVGLVFGLVNIGPGTWVVNNNSWAISLFLPASLVLGWGIDRIARRAMHWFGARAAGPVRRGWLRRGAAVVVLGLGAAGAGGIMRQGFQSQVDIVNPSTILATDADAEVLAWIAANVPHTAVFLVNGWLWQSGMWATQDGGAWLLPLTKHTTTLPPPDYTFGAEAWRRGIETFNQQAAAITDADTQEALTLLAGQGVTHIYVGARGGSWRPEMLIDSPHYSLAFTNGAAWVFVVKPATTTSAAAYPP